MRSAERGGGFFAIDHFLGRFPDLINDADEFQKTQNVISWVDLPPEETLTCAVRVVVVIVMPSFSKRKYCQNKAILARLTGFVAAAAQQMAEGIDGKSRVIKNHRAQAESP